MAITVGDRVAVRPKTLRASERLGIVEAVLAESPPRYQVRWDNLRWSIIAPRDGAVRVVPPSKPRPRRHAITPKAP